MEELQYEEINELELREIEAELGHAVTKELAYWFIRNRLNREAVERMLEAANTNRLRNVRDIKRTSNRKSVSIPKKRTQKCA